MGTATAAAVAAEFEPAEPPALAAALAAPAPPMTDGADNEELCDVLITESDDAGAARVDDGGEPACSITLNSCALVAIECGSNVGGGGGIESKRCGWRDSGGGEEDGDVGADVTPVRLAPWAKPLDPETAASGRADDDVDADKVGGDDER